MRCPICTDKKDDLSGNKRYAWCRHCHRIYRKGSLEIKRDTFVDALRYIGRTIETEKEFFQTYTDD